MENGNLEIIGNYLFEVASTLDILPLDKIATVVQTLYEAYDKKRRIFTFGNGGSAATASHFATDLAKGTIYKDKPRFKVIALTDNIPLLSAWANDTRYSDVFAEQLANLVEPEDIAIAISGSGNSPNVLNGIKLARARGATTIGFVGFDGGKLKNLVDISLEVPNYTMAQVEDIHLIIGHVITACLQTWVKLGRQPDSCELENAWSYAGLRHYYTSREMVGTR